MIPASSPPKVFGKRAFINGYWKPQARIRRVNHRPAPMIAENRAAPCSSIASLLSAVKARAIRFGQPMIGAIDGIMQTRILPYRAQNAHRSISSSDNCSPSTCASFFAHGPSANKPDLKIFNIAYAGNRIMIYHDIRRQRVYYKCNPKSALFVAT